MVVKKTALAVLLVCSLAGVTLAPVQGVVQGVVCDLTVTTTADGDDGECALDCTLREAIATASPGFTVCVPAGTYSLTLGTLVLDKDLEVTGAGEAYTILEASVGPPPGRHRAHRPPRRSSRPGHILSTTLPADMPVTAIWSGTGFGSRR